MSLIFDSASIRKEIPYSTTRLTWSFLNAGNLWDLWSARIGGVFRSRRQRSVGRNIFEYLSKLFKDIVSFCKDPALMQRDPSAFSV